VSVVVQQTAPQPAAKADEADLSRVLAAAAALGATLIVGLFPSPAAPVLFGLGALASFLLVRRAFPAMWLYSVWLLALYALAFLAAMALGLSTSVSGTSGGPTPLLGGAFILGEVLAVYVGFSLFAEIKSIRDFRTRLSITRGDSPPEYRRIGLWAMSLLVFFFGANLSAVLFVGWARGEPLLPIHAAVEAMLIGLGIYVLYIPEVAFGSLPPEYRQAAAASKERGQALGPLLEAAASTQGASRVQSAICPLCGKPLARESRACPKCAATTEVGWCASSEVHVVPCEKCSKPVVYGKPVCPHCRSEIPEALKCSRCLVHSSLSEWKPAVAS
jgi:hypothetical protein